MRESGKVPRVRINDIQMYYEVNGRGFPLLMIMGLGASLDAWNPRMIQGLAKNFKTIMFDNRGAGRTEISDREYTIGLFADDTAGLMDALGISRAHILGLSMGGCIAQELALDYPERVEKLVLCSTSCGKGSSASKDVWSAFLRSGSMLSTEEGLRLLVSLSLTKEFMDKNTDIIESYIQKAMKAPTSPEGFSRQVRALSFNAFDRVSGITAPTLVLHGKRDILAPPDNGSILAKAIPNAKFVLFEESAHLLAEDVEEATNAITEFLL
jgi:pimeloyl-ACP methyl ester carboxylesterase